MWLRRFLTISVFVFIQLLVIADVANRRADDPTLVLDWTLVFSPIIFYIAIASLFVLATLYAAGLEFFRANYLLAPRNTISTAEPSMYADHDSNYFERSQALRNSKIYFADAIIDSSLLVLLSVFVALLVNQLEEIDAGVLEFTRSWFLVFTPLYLLLFILLVISIGVAVRVYAESRYDRNLNTTDCCGAAFGDLFCCCTLDEMSMEMARATAQDKRRSYIADASYHQLPCAFMCTSSMSYGAIDVLLSWLWFLFVVAAIVVHFLLAANLQSKFDEPGEEAQPSLGLTFLPFFISIPLLLLGSLLQLIVLCCCYRRLHSRPRGRKSILYKYVQLLLTTVFAVAAITQFAVLSELIDAQAQSPDYHITLLPSYLFLTVIILVGCCSTVCNGGSNNVSDDEPTAHSVYAANVHNPTSMWGLFSAVQE